MVAGAAAVFLGAPAALLAAAARHGERPIAPRMTAAQAAWLERPSRQRQERPDLLVATLGLQPGQCVADVGCGTGYLARRLAPALGSTGRLCAVDVDPEMLSLTRQFAARDGVEGIETRIGSDTDPDLPAASLDLALLVDTYHELLRPQALVAAVVRALKPGGRLVVVEYRAEDPRLPIPAPHRMSEARIRDELAGQRLAWERAVQTLPYQHMVFFRRTGA